MSDTKNLARFVRDALSAGQSRDAIRDTLGRAGWSPSEVDGALRGWADVASPVPVPRPQATLSARDFFVYTLTFGLLIYASYNLVTLLHLLIDTTFGDEAHWSGRKMRWAMATVIVTLPGYLWLTWRDQRAVARDPARYRSVVRKWLIYITLLASSAVMLGDLVFVLEGLLDGDFTLQFLAKALVVAIVAGGIFLYYLGDVRRGDAS